MRLSTTVAYLRLLCLLYPARGCVDLLRTRRFLRGVNSCETYERQQNSANSQILWRANELEAWIGMHYGVLTGRKQTGHKKPQVPFSTRMRNGAECAGKLMRMRSLHQRSRGLTLSEGLAPDYREQDHYIAPPIPALDIAPPPCNIHPGLAIWHVNYGPIAQ